MRNADPARAARQLAIASVPEVSDVVLCLKRELRLLEYTFVDVRLQDDNGVYVVDHLRQVRNGRHHTMGQEFFPWVASSANTNCIPGANGFPLVVDLGRVGEVSGVELGRSRAGRWLGVHTPGRN